MNRSPLIHALLTRDFSTAGYVLGWKLVGAMPDRWAEVLFNGAAKWASKSGRGPEQLRKNLSRVVGPENVTRELVIASMQSYARYWREAFRLPRLTKHPEFAARLDPMVEGKKYLDNSIAAGRGVVLTLPHSGNWDMAGVWLVHHNGQFATVAERLKPEVLYDAFVEFREGLGFEVIPLTGGPAPYPRLVEVVRNGGVVALMGERDLKESGIEVDFFGELTRFPAGPARLAIETGAALHVVDCHFTDGGWGMSVSPPVEVGGLQETVQKIADGFEVNIANHPEDWHMLQPQWLADVKSRWQTNA